MKGIIGTEIFGWLSLALPVGTISMMICLFEGMNIIMELGGKYGFDSIVPKSEPLLNVAANWFFGVTISMIIMAIGSFSLLIDRTGI